ncbi:MAG TPA: hypothetical protein PK156_28200 [Polyangium sp.]|nr:hypothetical protein [Polyangium sp.]
MISRRRGGAPLFEPAKRASSGCRECREIEHRQAAFSPVWASSLSVIASLVCLSSQGFASAIRTDYPCKGCLYWPPPENAQNSPLLVVLHGDAPGGKTPLVKRDSEPFVKVAVERGISVLAPMCPKDEGCRVGSYWQWVDGDPPAWIAKQIDAVRRDFSLDADRTWIAGWSGGASFLGYHYMRLGERYAAVVFAGGGIAPAAKTCASCSPPAYFMVGDKNPLHHLAKDLKTNVLSCTKDVTWDLLPGNDHAGEWRSLGRTGKVGEILDWLAKHPRTCGVASIAPIASAPSSQASAAPSAMNPRVESQPATSAPISKPVPVSPKPSGCAVRDFSGGSAQSWLLLLALAAIRTARRRFIRASVATNQTEMVPKKA